MGKYDAKTFETPPDGEGDFSDWVSPKPTYLMGCCDCGLVHTVEFKVIKRTSDVQPDGTYTAEDIDDDTLKVAFRMKREDSVRHD